jgi:hypothetical protein
MEPLIVNAVAENIFPPEILSRLTNYIAINVYYVNFYALHVTSVRQTKEISLYNLYISSSRSAILLE